MALAATVTEPSNVAMLLSLAVAVASGSVSTILAPLPIELWDIVLPRATGAADRR